MAFRCIIRFESTTVELCVSFQTPEVWRWSIQLSNGIMLEEGTSATQLAAQMATQRAFEKRLLRAELGRHIPETYLWKLTSQG